MKNIKKRKNHLWSLRRRAGYKVSEVCSLLKISDSMIYEMEKGNRKPSSDLAGKMADLYNCTMDTIYNYKPRVSKKSCKQKQVI